VGARWHPRRPGATGLVPACPAGDFDCAVNSGSIYQLRAGLEARYCGSPNIVCAVLGVDVAFSHTSLMGPPSYDTAIVLPRAGLDLGTRHIRFHIAFEIGKDTQGSGAEGLDAGLGYEW
jgi:hypothetical protein